MMNELFTHMEIACTFLKDKVVQTPVRRLKWLEEFTGVPVWVKLENQQHTGSFKYRGALYSLHSHPKEIPVLAASAGNHGLAVAQVCQQLGLKANIYLPSNASRLKRQRILETGAGLIEYGSSLDEAILYAKDVANKNGWRFISPYNEFGVIAANSSISQEFFNQVSDLQYLIIPVGGGGLISGMAIAGKQINHSVKIFGCEPKNYASVIASLAAKQAVKVPNMPTFADGLAVNLEPNAHTLNFIAEYVDDMVMLDEEALAFSVFALLNKESLLIEPSGCAGIAALIELSHKIKFTGSIGIVLCGGNIQKNILNRILQFNFSNSHYKYLLDLKGQSVLHTPISKSYSGQNEISKPLTVNNKCDNIEYQISEIRKEAQSIKEEIDAHLHFCDSENLPYDSQLTAILKNYLEQIDQQIDQLYPLPQSYDFKELNLIENKIRWLLQALSHVSSAIDWRAAAYDQSHITQFFSLSSQENPGVNYDRYNCPQLKRIEEQLSLIFNIPRDLCGITITSSGMAAFSLIESFILRYCVTSNSTFLMTPYIYFEAKEQLESLKLIKLKQAKGFSAQDLLVALQEDSSIDVIFADPLSNIVEQPVTDMKYLISELAKLNRQKPIRLVIDGTMVSGALLPEILTTSDKIEIIYYESCSKYLQMGLESCLAGIVIYPIKYQANFERLRRNMGSILYKNQAISYPYFTREQFFNRIHRICKNASSLALLLNQDPEVLKIIDIFYPTLTSHPNYHIAINLPYAGGCVTFQFKERGKNNNNFLEAFITKLLHFAKNQQIPLIKGLSFGYTFPRISAASSIAESEYPFLRLYVGDLDENLNVKLADIFAEALLNL
ncbi:MAG TPA: pyridoxal-phosphate dependent enzyme [Patescibacteria group bacterium]|nr:pyridoxal-phosphate dependent enzyme [Gammaproteobacteria bacterium]HWA51486.1 pyridoxal-phosphate dependent enzyme [Patescibacteria group bacterium]